MTKGVFSPKVTLPYFLARIYKKYCFVQNQSTQMFYKLFNEPMVEKIRKSNGVDLERLI